RGPYTPSLHDALPISGAVDVEGRGRKVGRRRQDVAGEGRRVGHLEPALGDRVQALLLGEAARPIDLRDVGFAQLAGRRASRTRRSEEHTSELQSRFDL